ncbi:MAG: glutamine amidotransferase [Oscillibacter sp.]|jgi:uncharacterized membrane protein|nr:glutamine amidotransferase [Oscillibacter sp.]
MHKKILFAGESWISYSRHIKGFDSFFTSRYEEGVAWIRAAIEKAGYQFDYVSNTYAAEKFPRTAEELAQYDAVFLSDIGSNTLLLTDQCFVQGQRGHNRMELLRDFVLGGGGLCMIGGYMSFSGIEAKARYGRTALAEVLPVKCLEIDDRVEAPQGFIPQVTDAAHPSVAGLTGEWPYLLGYNETVLRDGAKLVATIGKDPLIAAAEYGKGRSLVFTSDCSPHWGSPAFTAWDGYDRLWKNVTDWLTRA